jgi:hypothetical protein
MKKIITLLAFLIISMSAYSQSAYPRFEKDSSGLTVVLMTIEQAQKLDNSSDLLPLFEKLNLQIGEYDSLCIKVLNSKDQVISLQNLQIQDFKKLTSIKDEKILNLAKTNVDKEIKIQDLNKIIVNKDDEIDLHLKEIKKTKRRYLLGGTLGGTILGIVVYSLLR